MGVDDAELQQIINAIKEGFKEGKRDAAKPGSGEDLGPGRFAGKSVADVIGDWEDFNEVVERQKQVFKSLKEFTLDYSAGIDTLDEAVSRSRTNLGAWVRSREENQILADLELESLQKREQALNALITAKLKEGTDKSEILKLKKVLKQVKEQRKGYKLATQSTEKMGKSMKSMVKSFGGADGLKNMLNTDSLVKGFGNLKSVIAGGSGSMALWIQQAWAAAGPAAIGALLDAVKDLVFELVDLENAFRKATGASAEMARGITDVYGATRQYGVTTKDASASTAALYGTFTDFTMVSKEVRNDLAATGAVMAKLGVSTETYAKSVQGTTKMFGTAARHGDEVMLGIAAHAMDIGVAPSQMTSDFANMTPKLAKLGTTGEKAFKDLARTAKITGLEIGKLLQITDKFDTFEGAATQAGKLNAALGGNFVNAMDLMMATDPNERFGMIRDSILDAGLSFDSMSYYQTQFYADTLGLADAGELALVMSGNMEALDSSMGKTQKDYENMAKQAAAFQSIQEKINTLLYNLIPIITPAIDALNKFLNMLVENANAVKYLVAGMLILVGAVGALVIALSILFGPVSLTVGAAMAVLSGILLAFTGLFIAIPETMTDLWDSLYGVIEPLAEPFMIMLETFDLLSKAMKDSSGELTGWGKTVELVINVIRGSLVLLWEVIAFGFKVLTPIGWAVTALVLAFKTLGRVLEDFNLYLKGSISGAELFGRTLLNTLLFIPYLIADAFDYLFGGPLQRFIGISGDLSGGFYKLADAVDWLKEKIMFFAKRAIPWLLDMWDNLMQTMFKEEVASTPLEALMEMASAFADIGKVILALISPVGLLVAAFTKLTSVLFSGEGGTGILGGIVDGVAGIAGGLVTGATSLAAGIVGPIKDTLVGAAETAFGALVGPAETAFGALTGVKDKLAAGFGEMATGLQELGGGFIDMATTIGSGIKDRLGEMATGALDMATGVIGGLKDKLFGGLDLGKVLPSPDTFLSIALAIGKIAEAIISIPTSKAVSFVTLMSTVGEVATAVETETMATTTTNAAAIGTSMINNVTANAAPTQVIVNNPAPNQQKEEQTKVVVKLDGADVAAFLKGEIVETMGMKALQGILGM
ncbi:hypothetical protein CMI47_06430 [Candidatus Pacearchaeota archaeon]|nr:hypothetical protein [Candidatus Pacearchaeota archaeon]|tara:strand:+ start:568 stop:3882 length:3315 start_codon:yes stop_codon:yes gene_type:complete